jgi:hypothetical protein
MSEAGFSFWIVLKVLVGVAVVVGPVRPSMVRAKRNMEE